MPAPFVEFAQFIHPHRWWLRRALPPWLDDPRWTVRAFRTSLALGVMGTVTGWLSALAFFFAHLIPDEELLGPSLFILIDGIVGPWTGPGFWFGVGVLIPLSRWLGRNWIFSLLSVPASMFACYCGVSTSFIVEPFIGPSPDWVPFDDAEWMFASFAGAAIVSIWMGNPFQKSAWLAGLTATVLAAAGCSMLPWLMNDNPPWLAQSQELLQFAGPYVTFQSLTAIGLGMRLWWDRRTTQNDMAG